jgi:hypothetical protein
MQQRSYNFTVDDLSVPDPLLELAIRDAEKRRIEIRTVLSSRRVVWVARHDPRIRQIRLEILEELAFAPHPSPALLAAARQLAMTCKRFRWSSVQIVIAMALGVAALSAVAFSAVKVGHAVLVEIHPHLFFVRPPGNLWDFIIAHPAALGSLIMVASAVVVVSASWCRHRVLHPDRRVEDALALVSGVVAHEAEHRFPR